MRMPWLIYENGQVHRFIVPTFLHFGFSHIVITTLLQLSLGTVIESFMGTGRFIVYYTFVCIGSNLFGALCSSKYAIGSDPVIFGFLATLFSVMLVYWERIPGTNCTKVCQTLMMVMVFIVVAMLLTTSAQQYSSYTSRVSIIFPDLYGSIGGFVYGYLAGMMLLPIDNSSAGRFGRERII